MSVAFAISSCSLSQAPRPSVPTQKSGVFSCKAKGFDVQEGFNEGFEIIGIGKETVDDIPTLANDLSRDADKSVEETFEFHAYNVCGQQWIWAEQSEPGFEVPGQGGTKHIGPVGQQV